MSDHDDRMSRWAEDVLDEHARVTEHLTEDEQRDRLVMWWADFLTLAADDGDGIEFLIADPRDDPNAILRYLVEDEGNGIEFACRVLNKLSELADEVERR